VDSSSPHPLPMPGAGHQTGASETSPAPGSRGPNEARANRPFLAKRRAEAPPYAGPRRAAANWDLFRLFCAVAETGSTSRAARELGMSQPTLSRRLKELERYIGAPLFFRNSSGVKLTQEGEDLRHSSAGLMAAFESFHRELHARVGERSSVVRISAPEGLTKYWLLPRVKRLHELNGRVCLEILSTIRQQAVATSDLDLVIRMGDPGESELVGKKVGQVSFGLFASETYLAAHPAPRTLAELNEHDIIGMTADFPVLQGERAGQMPLKTYFQAVAEKQSRLRVAPVTAHFTAAVEGLGLAFLPVPFARAENLVRVLPQESVSMNVWLLRRRESELRKLTREVRRFFEEEFEASKQWLSGEALDRAAARQKASPAH
jgi:DNA-binding transcriptional LysR family regulator